MHVTALSQVCLLFFCGYCHQISLHIFFSAHRQIPFLILQFCNLRDHLEFFYSSHRNHSASKWEFLDLSQYLSYTIGIAGYDAVSFAISEAPSYFSSFDLLHISWTLNQLVELVICNLLSLELSLLVPISLVLSFYGAERRRCKK